MHHKVLCPIRRKNKVTIAYWNNDVHNRNMMQSTTEGQERNVINKGSRLQISLEYEIKIFLPSPTPSRRCDVNMIYL